MTVRKTAVEKLARLKLEAVKQRQYEADTRSRAKEAFKQIDAEADVIGSAAANAEVAFRRAQVELIVENFDLLKALIGPCDGDDELGEGCDDTNCSACALHDLKGNEGRLAQASRYTDFRIELCRDDTGLRKRSKPRMDVDYDDDDDEDDDDCC